MGIESVGTSRKPNVQGGGEAEIGPATAKAAREAESKLVEYDVFSLAPAGERVPPPLGEFPLRLPALDHVIEQAKGQSLSGYVLFGVQHLLASKVPLFKAFEALGMAARDIHLLGVPYSSNAEVASYFVRQGYHVKDGRGDLTGFSARLYGKEDFHAARLLDVEAALDEALADARLKAKKLLVLDDGGQVSLLLAQRVKKDPSLLRMVKVVEQTTRGITELEGIPMPFPVVDVARSPGKKLEAQHIGRSLARNLLREWGRLGIRDPKGMRATVVGYGWVGEALVGHLLRLGVQVSVVDTDPVRRAQVPQGVDVRAEVASALDGCQALIGCTGRRSVTMEDLERLPANVIVASGSSAEVEFPMAALRQRAFRRTDVNVGMGDTQSYVLGGKPLFMIADGRPANFDYREQLSVETDYIQLTLGLMLLGALQAAQNTTPGIVALSSAQDSLIDVVSAVWVQAPVPQVAALPVALPPSLSQPASVVDALASDFNPPAHARYHQEWQRYWGGLAQVLPRVGSGSRFYRDEKGDLFFVDPRPWRGGYTPVGIAGVDGVLLDLEWLRGAPFVKLVTHSEGGEREWYLRYQQQPSYSFELVFSRRRCGLLGAIVEQGCVFILDGEKNAVVLRSLEDGQAKSATEVPEGEGAEFFSAGPLFLGGGAIARDDYVLRTTRKPPSLTLLSRDLKSHGSVDLSPYLAVCGAIYPLHYGNWVAALGTNADGSEVALLVHPLSGRCLGLVLPKDFFFERFNYDATLSAWTAVLRPRHGSRERWQEQRLVLEQLN